MDCDPQASAPDGSLSLETLDRLEEAPRRHNPELDIIILSSDRGRLEQGLGGGSEHTVLSPYDAPSVVERLDDGEALANMSDEKFIWQDGVEHLADLARGSDGRGG